MFLVYVKNMTQSALISIKNFLSSSDFKEFKIPIYQRSYSWDKEQIKDFLGDFDGLLLNPNRNKYHFFGLVVLCEDGTNNKVFEIIDGQQRITTISLLLSILRDHCSDLHFHHMINSDLSLKDELEETKNQINGCLNKSGLNLKLNTLNEAVYESDYLKIILNKLGALDPNYVSMYNHQLPEEKCTYQIKIDALSETPKFNQTKGKSRPLRRNFQFLNEEIKNNYLSSGDVKVDARKIIEMSNLVLENFKIIPFVAVDQPEAFALFETLNDRGLDVAAVDLIKNLCLKQSQSQQHRSVLFDSWREIFTTNLDGLDGVVFLRYSNNSKDNFITKSELYKAFSEKVESFTQTELTLFVNSLKDDSLFYARLIKDKPNTDLKLENVLKLLRSTKTSQWYTLGLAVLRCLEKYKNDQNYNRLFQSSIDLLLKTHKLIISIMIKGQGMNQIERFIPSLAVKLNNSVPCNSLIDLCEECILGIENLMSAKMLLITSTDLNSLKPENNVFSLSLLTIVSFVNLRHAATLPVHLTLEHVFPKNPRQRNNDWPEIDALGSEDKIENCLHSIGNHIPLLQGLNREVSNKSFGEKKNHYISNSVGDVLMDVSVNVTVVNNWTPEIIEKRKQLINTILTNYLLG